MMHLKNRLLFASTTHPRFTTVNENVCSRIHVKKLEKGKHTFERNVRSSPVTFFLLQSTVDPLGHFALSADLRSNESVLTLRRSSRVDIFLSNTG